MDKDWVDDDQMSAAETLARFDALMPVPTANPVLSTGFQLQVDSQNHLKGSSTARTMRTTGAANKFSQVHPAHAASR